jgi:hypothetical protein
MHNNQFNNHKPQPLFEALEFKDLEGMLKPTIHIDDFAAKMGDDDDIIVASFFTRDKAAAKDLVDWFEKGYDFVLDADQSPGEIKPNRFLVYVEMRRRSAAPGQLQELLSDLSTLTEFDPSDWTMVYKNKDYPWNPETFAKLVPLSPRDYRDSNEKDLNEWRIAAGMATKPVYETTPDIKSIQSAAGII